MNKYKLILEISNNHYMQKITTLVDTIFPPEYFENYTVKKIVGKGSYGHVAKAIRKNQQMYVAIKKITNLFNSLPETRRILR